MWDKCSCFCFLLFFIFGCSEPRRQPATVICGKQVDNLRIYHTAFGEVTPGEFDSQKVLSVMANLEWQPTIGKASPLPADWRIELTSSGEIVLVLSIHGQTAVYTEDGSSGATCVYWLAFERDLLESSSRWHEYFGGEQKGQEP